VPRRGYRTQPRVSTLGIVHQERHALKGRQIERPNKAVAGSDGPIVARPIAHSARQLVQASSGTRISRRFQGEPFILRVPRVETLG
jgi:hypothetical protein